MTDLEDYESLIACPECDRMVDEDCDMCPGCGYFLTDRDRHTTSILRGKPRGLFLVAAILLILIFLAPLISRMIDMIWPMFDASAIGS